MKHSPYITWAKQHHQVRYNLASSGVTTPTLETLGVTPDDFALTEEHEEGWPPLIDRIAFRYGVSGASVALAQGTSMANHMVFALCLEPGDHVVIERPCYEPLHVVPSMFHAEIDFFERPRDEKFRVDVHRIEQKLMPHTRLVVLSNLHNPTGQLMTPQDLQGLGELAMDRDFHVLIDEVYLEWLAADGVTTAAGLSPRFITTRSLTKAYGLDAVRAGWILAEEETASRLRRIMDLYSVKMVHASERLALRAFDAAENILGPLAKRLDAHRKLVHAFVEADEALSWVRPVAGSVGFVYWKDATQEEMDRLIAALLERDALVAPGKFFGAPGAFRLGYGMETDRLEAGLERLGEALRLARPGSSVDE